MPPVLLERYRAAMRLPAVLEAAARYLPLTGAGGLQDTWHQLNAIDNDLLLDDDGVFAGAWRRRGTSRATWGGRGSLTG